MKEQTPGDPVRYRTFDSQDVPSELEREEQHRCYHLAYGRCYWTGNWRRDYLNHVRNTHPLVSCFLCDPQHPYSRGERLAVLVVTMTLMVLPAGVLAVALERAREQHNHTSLPVLVFVYVTLPVMLVDYFMAWLATLDFQVDLGASRSTSCSSILRLLASLVRAMKYCCFCVVGSFTCIVVLLCIMVLHKHKASVTHALWPLALSRFQSWITWFLFDLFMPFWGFVATWSHERRQHFQSTLDKTLDKPMDKPMDKC